MNTDYLVKLACENAYKLAEVPAPAAPVQPAAPSLPSAPNATQPSGGFFTNLRQSADKAVGEVGQGLRTMGHGLADAGRMAFHSVTDPIKSIASKAYHSVADPVSNAYHQIVDEGPAVVQQTKDLANQAYHSVRDPIVSNARNAVEPWQDAYNAFKNRYSLNNVPRAGDYNFIGPTQQ